MIFYLKKNNNNVERAIDYLFNVGDSIEEEMKSENENLEFLKDNSYSIDSLSNEIQDIYTRKDHDHFYQGAIDFREAWVIEDNDMVILNNVDALWEAIVGCLHTPKGIVDGVGLETYGSKLLELRGKTLNYHIMELAKTL